MLRAAGDLRLRPTVKVIMNDEPGPLRDLVAGYLAEQCRVLIEAEPQLRAGENVIHSTRVAVRRLRSTLRTCADLFDPTRAEQLEPELVWWAGQLGAVRDLDILTERMERRLADLPAEMVLGPVANTITVELNAQRQDHFKEVIAALDSSRYRALMIELHRWQNTAPFTEAADIDAAEVARYVRRAGKKLDRRLEEAAEACRVGDDQADDLLHRSRKAGKRHRYVVELAQPIWGSKADKIINRRKKLQDVLGDHQDSHVAAAFLRELGARVGTHEGQNGFSYGVLLGMEREHLQQMRDALARSKQGSAETALLALAKS
jgi:CHAD domain-containing protein